LQKRKELRTESCYVKNQEEAKNNVTRFFYMLFECFLSVLLCYTRLLPWLSFVCFCCLRFFSLQGLLRPLSVVSCLLPVVYCLLSAVCCLSSAVCSLPLHMWLTLYVGSGPTIRFRFAMRIPLRPPTVRPALEPRRTLLSV
jgi:hypothetical protein